MVKKRRVVLLIPSAQISNIRRLQGVADYARRQADWALSINPMSFSMPVTRESLRDCGADGLILFAITKEQQEAALGSELPVVNLSSMLPPSRLPRVMVDNAAVGRLAAEHLLERGLQRFAFFGEQETWCSAERARAFSERLAQANSSCSCLDAPCIIERVDQWRQWERQLEDWLKSLEAPVGLFGQNDNRALMAVDACLRLGLRVPEDVAVLGARNSEVACELSQVSLSSIGWHNQEVGYKAAELLDQLMQGVEPDHKERLVAPYGVVERRSTQLLAVDDEHVLSAARLIRDHLHDSSFSIDKLCRMVPVSRRWLERRFGNFLHCTPHEYLCRARVQHAIQLLESPEKLTMREIAHRCGFDESRQLRVVFQRITGRTPTEYRQLATGRL